MSKQLIIEAQRHKDAFEFYYTMDKRSYREVAKRYKVSEQAVAKWSLKYHWQERIVDRDKEAEDLYRELMAKRIREANKTHLTLYQMAQARASEKLKKDSLNTLNTKDAADVLDKSIKGEREILGLRSASDGGQEPAVQNIQTNIAIAIGEMTKNGERGIILQALKRIRAELTQGQAGK